MEIGPDTVVFDRSFVYGFIFIAIAGFAARQSAEGWANWINIWQPMGPDLHVNQSPIDNVLVGIGGLLSWGFWRVMMIIFSVLAFDQFFLSGSILARVWGFVRSNWVTL